MPATIATYYAVLAGISASLASIFGKLTFSQSSLVSFVTIFYLICFVVSNVFMWRSYSKALSVASTSIQPTILTKTSNFLLSTVVGYFAFAESINWIWLLGFALILCGVYLISKEDESSYVQVSSHLD
jgi:drug/metabolite transporter (DMT)-like permease